MNIFQFTSFSSVCSVLNLFLCSFFILSILLRKLTDTSANVNKIAHASMCVTFLSAAADVVDFLEYVNNTHIIEQVSINAIMGNEVFLGKQSNITFSSICPFHCKKSYGNSECFAIRPYFIHDQKSQAQ